ncbi:MAG: hypothetical protein LCI00_32325 [Chloroflexi bacterium]|nr:hypothetical protein [Chloroflexota bacterium]MCC6894204.1 hypothetical protein [Anaerolineae bacterium]
MTNDERDLNPESENNPAGFDQTDDDLRYAPPADKLPPVSEPEDETEQESLAIADEELEPVVEEDLVEETVLESDADDTVILTDVESAVSDLPLTETITEPSVEVTGDSLPVNVTDGLDIEAALAAVSTLNDVIAEQEAAEQARLARIEADAQAKAERQARLENPERYFPVPPLSTLKRGQLASVIPAVLLIGIGGWLTFSGTSLRVLPDTNLFITIILVGIGLALFTRWLAARRWSRGSLLFGLLFIALGGVYFYLAQPASVGLQQGWPLFIAASGLALLLTWLLSSPKEPRLVLPAFILLIAGVAGSLITLNLLPTDVTFFAASVWPVAIVIIVLIWLLPLVFRQRQ